MSSLSRKRTLGFLGNVIWMYHSMVATLTLIILFIEMFKFIFKKSKLKKFFKKKNWNPFFNIFFNMKSAKLINYSIFVC
jgi:hypothetical protein